MPTYYPPGTRRNNRFYVVKGRIDGRQREIRTGSRDKAGAEHHWQEFKAKVTGKRDIELRYGPPRVYFIAVGKNAIKIGVAKNVEARLVNLQIGNPKKLRLIGSIRGDEKTEKMFHVAFSKYHVRGEWFKAAAPLLQFIEFFIELDDSK